MDESRHVIYSTDLEQNLQSLIMKKYYSFFISSCKKPYVALGELCHV